MRGQCLVTGLILGQEWTLTPTVTRITVAVAVQLCQGCSCRLPRALLVRGCPWCWLPGALLSHGCPWCNFSRTLLFNLSCFCYWIFFWTKIQVLVFQYWLHKLMLITPTLESLRANVFFTLSAITLRALLFVLLFLNCFFYVLLRLISILFVVFFARKKPYVLDRISFWGILIWLWRG